MNLNGRAAAYFERLAAEAAALRIGVETRPDGATILDFGIAAAGGLEAGRRLAELCLSNLGQVALGPPRETLGPWPTVCVRTDHPLAACLASQYAGWQLASGKFFAMGSGPMRAAARREELFRDIDLGESADVVVGVLETRKSPPDEVIAEIAAKCGTAPSGVRVAVAPTASQAGHVQVVARAIETALHKLHVLKFDLTKIVSGFGTAPLPPVAADDLTGIGRTNDAVIYGGEVTLWVRGDDADLEAVGPRVPGNSSADYGAPFADIFARYDRDFYRIDPQLFSPATVCLVNLDTGRTFRYGATDAAVLRRSFHG